MVEEDFGAANCNRWLRPPHYRCSPQLQRYQQGTPRSRLSRFRPLAELRTSCGRTNAVGASIDQTTASSAPMRRWLALNIEGWRSVQVRPGLWLRAQYAVSCCWPGTSG